MGVAFTINHVGGGSKRVDVSPDAVEGALVAVLDELADADDEHYQAAVVNSAGAGMTIFDSGLMAWDADIKRGAAKTRYYRPTTRAEVIEMLNAFVHLRTKMFAPRFTPEVPPPAPGLSFLLVEMGEFALNRAAWARNFTRVKQLVEAGHDVNQRTPEGTTPLMGAVSEGQAAMCQYLIERGADVTVRLPSSGWGTDNWSLLRLARKDGTSTVVKLLEEAGAPE